MLLLKSKPEMFILILLLVSTKGIADVTSAFLPPATDCKDAYSVIKHNIYTKQLTPFPLLNNRKCKICYFANKRNEDQDAISVAKESQGDWTDATIVSCEKACPSGKSYLVRIQTIGDQNCADSLMRNFKVPGQFVQLRYKEEDPIFLAMSSSPGKPYLEFLIKMSPRLPWLEEALIEGQSSIQLSHVMGDGFPINEKLFDPKINQIFLIAAGSGIAPLKACIESGQLSPSTPSTIITKLYYGEWTTNDLCFTELYSLWKKDYGVDVIPVLSRQQPSAFATRKNYAQYALEQDGILSPDKTLAIICGMDEMVDSTMSMLKDVGVPQDQILLNL